MTDIFALRALSYPGAHRRRCAAAVLGATLLTVSCAVPRLEANTPVLQVERLSWLQGCWVREAGTLITEEQWMAPRGGTMIGMSRTTRGGRTIEWEHLRIEERRDTLVYIAIPSGQRETTFRVASIGDSTATFENPQHDFPQRVRYSRTGADSLSARIEGTREGQERAIDFHFRRAACP